MSYTINDFIRECETYPHSKENYEILKECYEIDLQTKFIEDQLFAMNECYQGRSINFDHMYESVDNENLQVLMEEANTKSTKLITRILTRLNKIFVSLRNFFLKITNKFDPITRQGEKLLGVINNMGMSTQNINDIEQIVNSALADRASAFPIKGNQPFKKNINIRYADDYVRIDTLKDKLAVALSNDIVVADASLHDDQYNFSAERVGLMDPDFIIEQAIPLINSNDPSLVTQAIQNVMTEWTKTRVKGVVIRVNTQHINETADKLNRLTSQLTAVLNNYAKSIGGYGDALLRKVGNRNTSTEEAEYAKYKEEQEKKPTKTNKPKSNKKPENNNAKTESFDYEDDYSNFNEESEADRAGNAVIDDLSRVKSGLKKGMSSEFVKAAKGKAVNLNDMVINTARAISDSTKDYGGLTKILQEYTSLIASTVGATTTVYIQLNAYRSRVITDLSKWLNVNMDSFTNEPVVVNPTTGPESNK